MDYMVVFSYLKDGRRVEEHDTTYQYTAQDAVDAVREWYSDLDGLRIENVYKDINNRWQITCLWE